MISASYLRVSTDLQAQANSVEGQRFALKMMCAGCGWDYADFEEFIDDGISGATSDRPAYQQLLTYIKDGSVRRVLTFDLDRISRDPDERSKFVRLCRDKNVEIIEHTGTLDAKTPTGMLLERIRSAVAEYQRAQLNARCSSGIRSKIAKGEAWGGARVFGKKGGKKYRPEREKEIAAMTGSATEIARKLRCSPHTVARIRKRLAAVRPDGAAGAA